MRNTLMKTTIVCLLVALLPAVAQNHQLGKRKATIVPERFLRDYDPITVFLPKARGPEKGGPIDDPNGLIKIQPKHPGEYRWKDGRTLQFLPTVPWPALEAFRVEAFGAKERLLTLMTPPVGMNPRDRSSGLDPISKIKLAFKQPIDPSDLSRMIGIKVQPAPGTDPNEGYELSERDFSIKVMERSSAKANAEYLIDLKQSIGYGHVVRLSLRLSKDTSLTEHVLKYRFTTKEPFRLSYVSAGSDSLPIASNGSDYTRAQALHGGSGRASLSLRFSARLGNVSLEQVKAMIRFEPAIKNLRHRVRGDQLELSFDAERERSYRVAIEPKNIHDQLGRKLGKTGPSSVFLYYTKPSAFLRWRESQGLLERYGPQMFPMEGRDVSRVDLRIYKIDPLDRNFWPYQREPLVVDEAQAPAGPGEEPDLRNNVPEHVRQLGSPLISKIIDLPMRADGSREAFGLDLKPYLAKISGKNAPGTYLVGYRPLGSDTQRYYVRVQVSDLSLSTVEDHSSALFAVTSLQTGKSLSGVKVVLEVLRSRKPVVAFSGYTDRNGFFKRGAENWNGYLFRLYLQKDSDVLVLDPTNAPDYFQNNHFYRDSWLSRLNHDGRYDYERAEPLAFIFTERPIYRPEEPVHLRGYLRLRHQGGLKAIGNHSYSLIVSGPGNKRWTYKVETDAQGNFYQKFDEADLPTGNYYFHIEDGRNYLGHGNFKKEAYRIPRFEVRLESKKWVPLDKPFEMELIADYYAGGRVVDQEVRWDIRSDRYNFKPKGYDDFLFSSDARFSRDRSESDSNAGSRTDRTDDNGSARLKLDPTTMRHAAPRRYVVEATVRGADEQTVTSTRSVLALPSFVLGLKMPRFMEQTGTFKPEVLVLGPDSKPLGGQEVELVMKHRQWHSYLMESDFTTGEARYVTNVVDTDIHKERFESIDEALAMAIELEKSGVYILELRSRDGLGRLQMVSQDLFVAGDEPVSWKKPKEDIFEASWDKPSYEPGEQAKLLLKSPWQTARALVVTEAPEGNRYDWVKVANGQGIFSLTVTDSMTPRMPVHVQLIRGRVQSLTADGKDLARPASKAATAWLAVKPKAFEVKVKVEHEGQCLPGSELPMTVILEDPDGNPLDGEVTLWLVDRAVLALGREASLNAKRAFLKDHPNFIWLRDTRNNVMGRLPHEYFPGGGGDGSEDDIFGRVTVRKNFQTVPFYKAGIEVRGGRAEVTIPMPDNLTDFAVRVMATSGASRFGYEKSKVSVRLPLIVQSALPRFVRPGDSFVAGGIGRVVEGDGGAGKVELKATGVRVEGETERALTWEKGKAQKLYFPMTVTTEAAMDGEDANTIGVSLAVRRDADDAMDAFEVSLPVLRDRDWETTERFVDMTAEPLALPEPSEEPRPGTLKRSVLLTNESAVVKMLAALNYLDAYPHGCTEQRVSKMMPQLELANVLSMIGRERETDALKRGMEETLIFLEGVQAENGHFSFWPGSRSYVRLTAYVVRFLVLARDNGYPVNEEMLANAVKGLKASLRSDYRYALKNHRFMERVHALVALSAAGHFDVSYARDLAARATQSGLAEEAAVLHTLIKEGVGDERLLETLKDDLKSSLIIAMEQGRETYQGLQYRTSSWGGLVLSSEVTTMASVAQALYRAEPDSPRNRLLVDALVTRGAGDGWGSTLANVNALRTLGEVLTVEPAEADGNRFVLEMGNETEEIDTSEQLVTRFSWDEAGPASLRWEGGQGVMPSAWLRQRYLPAARGDKTEAVNDGFVLERELEIYESLDASPRKLTPKAGERVALAVGQLVEEHVSVVNPEDRFYVAVRVPFAAGMEPLNPGLATAPPEAKPRGSLTLEPSYALYEDSQVTFYYDELPKGTYHFYFRLKAMTVGMFTQPAGRVELMYEQSVYGRGNGCRIEITE